MTRLPIDDVLPDIRAALARGVRLVVSAPPGAGKTTRAPLDLLDAEWLGGRRILLLEPRRIAARMAAERMAATLGERVGGRVGLSTRVDRRTSKETRVEVVTDGLFARRILADPELGGVGAVLFDEFHERSLALDLGLALAVDAQTALRPDLRLVLMSATIDTARLAAAFAAPIVASEGRQHPVETRYLGRADEPVEAQTERAVRRALREEQGSILVFLPGRGEILRVAERLADLPSEVRVAPLYGALSPAEQDAAVAPPPPGMRKVVLATDIAESALTIEGVRVVVDAGLARVAEHAPGVGATLSTRRASRANVDQRRGRAGRTAPGVCYRLWDEAATRGLPAEPTPEIATADLSGLVLALAEWGVRDAGALFWIDPPSDGRLAAARADLAGLGALGADGGLTEKGRAIAALPLEPRLAALVAGASDPNDRALAAEIAALVSERGLGGAAVDLRDRLERFRRDGSSRARVLREQAARWGGGGAPSPVAAAGRVVAAGAPLSIARRRDGEGGAYLLASGRAALLDTKEALAKESWIAVADLSGSAAGARVLAAAPLSEQEALALGGATTADEARFDPASKSLRARRVRRLGAIVLSETPLARPTGDAARAALLTALAAHGADLLPAADAVRDFAARLALARAVRPDELPDLSPETLITRADEWLAPLLGDPPSLDRPREADVARALLTLIGREPARVLEREAPASWTAPTGRALTIDYRADGAPRVEARVQEFYGLAAHPVVARTPLTLSLLSPAGRTVAVTRDLPGFWRGGYRDMAKDLRGRYPKHDWPDDPATAAPHVGKTKARLRREER